MLTVRSDSGSSSADLMGPMGATGPAGGKMFVAEFRLADGAFVCDKSFEEVKVAVAAGDVVVCEFVGVDSRTRGQLTTCTDYSITFVMQSILGADEYFTLTADGITHMTADNESEKDAPSGVNVIKDGNNVTVTAVYGFSEEVTTIALDDSGVPVTVTKDGKTTTLTWEGFD